MAMTSDSLPDPTLDELRRMREEFQWLLLEEWKGTQDLCEKCWAVKNVYGACPWPNQLHAPWYRKSKEGGTHD